MTLKMPLWVRERSAPETKLAIVDLEQRSLAAIRQPKKK
jgi:hypothetical protein